MSLTSSSPNQGPLEHARSPKEDEITIDQLEAMIKGGVWHEREYMENALTEWLRIQIELDRIPQQHELLARFVNLLHMEHFPNRESKRVSFTIVDRVLSRWLESMDATKRRRYLLAQQDMRQIWSGRVNATKLQGALSYTDTKYNDKKESLPTSQMDLSFEQRHSDSALQGVANKPQKPQHRETFPTKRGVFEGSDSGTKDFKENRPMKSGTMRGMRSTTVSSQDSEQFETTATPDIGGPLQHSLTNRPSRHGKAITPSMENQPASQKKFWPGADKSLLTMSSGPPKGYCCNRCGETGHFIQLCPTNLDPSYDRPPDNDYSCHICGKIGAHFTTLCPRNSDEHSLTQQRERIKDDVQRSALPKSEKRYRQRGGDCYRPSDSSQAEKSTFRRSGDRDSLSPYTARVRLTRELEKTRSSTNTRRSSSYRSGADAPDYHHQDRSRSPRNRRRDHVMNFEDSKSREGDEFGRLRYQSDIDLFDSDAPMRTFDYHGSDDEGAKIQADNFLASLAIELGLQKFNRLEADSSQFALNVASPFKSQTNLAIRGRGAHTATDQMMKSSDGS